MIAIANANIEVLKSITGGDKPCSCMCFSLTKPQEFIADNKKQCETACGFPYACVPVDYIFRKQESVEW